MPTTNRTIERTQVFRLQCEHLGEIKSVFIRAKCNIDSDKLARKMSEFATSDFNSFKFCGNESCNGGCYEFNMDFNVCPFCGKSLETEFKKPTLDQFIKEHRNILTKVNMITISSDQLAYSNF